MKKGKKPAGHAHQWPQGAAAGRCQVEGCRAYHSCGMVFETSSAYLKYVAQLWNPKKKGNK